MAENTSDNAISLQALVHVKRLEFDSIRVGRLFITSFKRLACFFSLKVVLKFNI